MIAYNTLWLTNRTVQEQANTALAVNCISQEENEQVNKAYPVGFYTPHFFVRIGLFILTAVIVLFSLGIFALLFMSAHEAQFGSMIVFFGLLVYAGLEFMVNKRHYRSGVDDALLWAAGINIVCGVNILTTISQATNAIIIFIIALFLFYRFANRLMAGCMAIAGMAVIFLHFIRFGEIAKALAPFVIMLAAVFLYVFSQRLQKQDKWKYHKDGFLVVSVIALILFYVASNYFVVRETSLVLFSSSLKEGESIPLGWLFWIFTVAIPILYIGRGVQRKDRVLLRTGLVLVAAIVFTVRYYYHFIPIEMASVIAGILLIVIAYALIKYLHEPKYGFTYKKELDPFLEDKLQIESMLIAQTLASGPQPADGGIRFGGGSGGGAGSSGEF